MTDAKGEDGWTALMHAAYGGRADAISALIQAGADFDCVNSDGRDAEAIAARCGHTRLVEMLRAAREQKMRHPPRRVPHLLLPCSAQHLNEPCVPASRCNGFGVTAVAVYAIKISPGLDQSRDRISAPAVRGVHQGCPSILALGICHLHFSGFGMALLCARSVGRCIRRLRLLGLPLLLGSAQHLRDLGVSTVCPQAKNNVPSHCWAA